MADMNELRLWHESIMACAKAQYDNDGWDNYVEGVAIWDFVGDYRDGRFTDFITALDYYTAWCKAQHARAADIRAEAF